MTRPVPEPPASELGPPTGTLPLDADVLPLVAGMVQQRSAELVSLRRWLHARPEVSYAEHGTTEAIRERLAVEGLQPRTLSVGTGLVCDIGQGEPVVALRADIDALAMSDAKDVPYRSTHPGACHACGHDVHTAVVLGAGLAVHELSRARALPGRLRLIFEPSEEGMPGGALDVIEDGWLEEVDSIFGVHCDPRLDAGLLGCRVGPITSAADTVLIEMTGPGGHTARPQLTVDLAAEAAHVVRDLPGRIKAGVRDPDLVQLVFGKVEAGSAPNVIPSRAGLAGSLRTPAPDVWDALGAVLPQALASILGTDLRPADVAPAGQGAGGPRHQGPGHQGSRHDGLHWRVEHRRGVPPVVNDLGSTRLMARAAWAVHGPEAATDTPHSWGGDTFGWYLHQVPGCYARLGTHWPGRTDRLELHRPTFDVDEAAIPFGATVLALAGLAAMHRSTTE